MTRRLLRPAVVVIVLVFGLAGSAAVAHAQNPPETIEYYATDALGSVRVVFTATGQVIGRSDYLPFGDTLNQSGALPKQRFTGQERDGEAGLDYFNARSLQMRTGRMNRPDPVFVDAMGSPQSWNRYSYVQNRPLVFTDPSGLCSTCLVFRSGVTVTLPKTPEPESPPEQMSDAAYEGSLDLLFHSKAWYESLSGVSWAYFGRPEGEGVKPPEQAQQPPQPKPDPPSKTGAPPPTVPACPSLGSRVWNNILTTNQVMPGALAPPFLAAGLGIPRQVAASLGTTTAAQAWSASVRGTSVVAGGVAWTATEAWILTVPTALVTFGAVGAAYEGGVAIGSLVDALFFDPCARR